MSETNIIVVGDAGVGKTNLINHFTNLKFEKMYIPTVKIKCHKLNNINIYDTGGQDKYDLTHYPNVIFSHCIIMYDVTNNLSYNSINEWKKKIIQFNKQIKFIIVGNKIDSLDRKIFDNSTVNISVKNNLNTNILNKIF